MSEYLDAALRYATLGIPVFPLWHVRNGQCGCGDPACENQGKHPETRHGVKDATTDPEIIGDGGAAIRSRTSAPPWASAG